MLGPLAPGDTGEVLTLQQAAFVTETQAHRDLRISPLTQSLAELRADIRRPVSDYCESHPRDAQQCAFEPFYFCESVAVTVPLGFEAQTLGEFRDALTHLSHATFYHHFITSRLRLQLGANDFSYWFANSLGAPELARRANRIDIYTNTLDSVRDELIGLVSGELNQ